MAVQNGRDLLIKMDMTGAGEFETVAGLVLARLGRVAEVGDEVEVGGVRLKVVEMEGVRIRAVEVTREAPGEEGTSG